MADEHSHDLFAQVDEVLDGAALWGLELEPQYRVLGVTLEPAPDRHPAGAVDDHRVQLLCFPVSTLLASLRGRDEDGAPRLHTFTVDQLVEVVAGFGGCRVSAPLFGLPEPRPGEWGPRYSLEGRSSAPDGTRSTLRLSVREGEDHLDVFARFDDAELRDAAGERLLPTT